MVEDNEEIDHSIIIVDDDPDILDLLDRTLSSDDRVRYEIITVGDAESAIDMMKKQDFDMIISDHKMAGMSGVELLSRVIKKYPDMIRILITGYSELDLAKEAINRAKVHHYIEKPWNNQDIRDTIYGALESKEKKDGREDVLSSLKELELEDGNSYLFKEKDSDNSMEFSIKKISEEERGLVITRVKPDSLIKKYDVDPSKIETHWLTRISGKGNLNPIQLELIADKIIRFYEKEKGIVLLEGVEALLRDNSFNRFIGFVDNIVDVANMEGGIFLVTLDPDTISEKELAHLERKMNQINL